MTAVAITGSGLYTPPHSISNDELVACYNAYVERFNADNAAAIAAGHVAPLQASSSEFIVKASGIRARYVVDREGILDVDVMRPRIPLRGDDQPSLMCEMGMIAARQALERAGRTAADIDFTVVACSNLQRPYPAIAVEIQHHLGCAGYAYDMNVACASAAFGIQAAVDAVRMGNARAALVISPEICSGHLNWRNRDCHFIFGDAATAVVVEPTAQARGRVCFEVLGTRLRTQFSNNIRNNFGFLNACEQPQRSWDDVLFRQEGRKVFKEVVPLVAELILGHLADLRIDPKAVRRFWLHQANLGMNQLIAKKVLGREPNADEAPVILDEYANTSSAGSVIAFHKYHEDLQSGEVAVLCAFGAGYSAGSVVMKRI
ncbi:beta-ketodecanoyl-[acyl-carrier-protein] synthase [Fontimonas thermophila]|uniref:Beta-ketodecanoyl-[acyl-carrier-protein] synthase n=1 Tax=Fontimonas thermophila TaxID=1076937 RepID=A0A1I2IS81_9GAMM|nr:beta-ketoacyl-ACP synthase III [Fontimonas thermophila]SFF45114.1 beta-ketodecanoyl-[acyl-carrier-protein] synthase [Fontimonas thermophila]